MPPVFIIGACAVVVAISWYSFARSLLTGSGAIAATLVGVIVVILGSLPAAIVLLAFFTTSTLLSRWRRSRKSGMDFEKGGARDAGQVLANGGTACLVLLAGALFHRTGSALVQAAFAAAIAEANADTWATEIGSASAAIAYLITTGKVVAAGRSGGVSPAGTLAALTGAALVAALGGILWRWPLSRVMLVALCGLGGSLIDSLLGATLQRRYTRPDGCITERNEPGSLPAGGLGWMGNDAVNFLGTLTAALAAVLIGLH
ncbi:MAG: DUF92 domain-containing protein [Capsulimonadaceae bacterium]|nr:DUF92 domain-containing protein [Capsulimonadaceae bacterium]